jgi:hypothetical protein
LFWENLFAHSHITGGVGFILLDVIEVIAMESQEHKGFMIVEAPGWMFKATRIIPSPHFKHPFNACTVESVKASIDYALKKMKPVNKYKPVNN